MPVVLLLLEYPTLNGGEYSLLSMIDHLNAGPWRFVAAAPDQGPLADALRRRRIPLVPLRLRSDGTGHRVPLEEARRGIRDVVERARPTLVHSNSLSMTRLAGPVTDDAGVPSIGHVRDIVTLSAAAMRDVNRGSRTLVVSRAALEFHRARGLDPSRAHVLYNGIDLVEFQPRSPTGYLARELGIDPDSLLVGSAGQIIARKGLDTLLEAATVVLRDRDDVHFVHCGERYSGKQEAVRYEESLREAAGRAPLNGRFHWLGYRQDVPRLLGELAVVVHPARQEPLGRFLLEAAASGVPVVATDVGGTAEIFSSPEQGALLVPQDDPTALADRLLELLNRPALRARLGAGGRARIERRFDVQRLAERLGEHYRQVMGSRATM